MSGELLAKDPLEGLPGEVAEVMAPYVAPPPAFLDAISKEIVKKRNEAKEARTASGIEKVWTEAEEAYIGIDNANRSEFAEAKWSKPMSMSGPVTSDKEPRRDDNKSTIFVRLTARYTDAGAAKLSEILLAPDDKSFSFTETPVPDLIKAKNDTSHVYHDALGPNPVPLFRPLRQNETPPQSLPAPQAPSAPVAPPTGIPAWLGATGVPTPTPPAAAAPSTASPSPAFPPAPQTASVTGTPQGQTPPAIQPPPGHVPLTVKDMAEEAIEIARAKAKRAEDRIYGWMVKSQYRAEARKVIFDMARLGVGVFKGPYPKPKRAMALVGGKDGQDLELQVKDEIIPAAKWVDPWNCFPDPACGENIHDGDYFLERDYLSDRQVRELEKTPGYIKAQLQKVMLAGPPTVDKSDGNQSGEPSEKSQKGRYEVWYFYGALKLRDFQCLCTAGNEPDTAKAMLDGIPKGAKLVYAIVTLIGDVAVRATLNPLDTGAFPYHSVCWQRRAAHWAGIGVPEQIRAPQRMVNGATRTMLDNAGLAAGGQIVIDKGSIIPADGTWALTPDKIWYRKGDSTVNDNRQAFTIYDFPIVTQQLKIIIDYALQLAEESTSIPLITQGQSGKTTPDTYGAAAIQDTNANQLLRSIAESWDDNISEPMTRQFYEWLLLDPNVPDDEKGDFEIDAHGSIALVERAIQDQTILQLGPTAANSVYGIDPKRWAKQLLKSKRLDPEDFTYTPEEQQRIDANPVKPPQVQVAEANNATREKIAAGEQALEGQKINNDHTQAAAESTVKLHEIQMEWQAQILRYANDHKMNLDQVKARLADTGMKLQVERELNAADNQADKRERHRQPRGPRERQPKIAAKPTSTEKPPVQTPGRAGNGRAFEQGNPA